MPALVLPDERAVSLAERWGTPLYVLDEAALRREMRAWKQAIAQSWPSTLLGYASKANSTLAVLRLAMQEGCLIDAASEGELRAALAAGVPARLCYLHGNNKAEQEIAFAAQAGVHHIVLDNLAEIRLLSRQAPGIPVVLRLAPGVDPKTHKKISTGQADTKFGLNIADGSAERAVKECLAAGLNVIGFHCHVGSQLLDPEAQISGGEAVAAFAAAKSREGKVQAQLINVGGGLGVNYSGQAPMAKDEYCRKVAEAVSRGLGTSGLSPVLMQEPGRSIVAEAGVTLYRVGVVKRVRLQVGGEKSFAVVDGGYADNPRPALYGAAHRLQAAPQTPREACSEAGFTVSGRHCETDTLFPDVQLRSDLQEGDIIQVLCTGAYNSSMASNYNRYRRPAAVLLREDGREQLVQRPETWDEMLSREVLPEDL